ETDLLRPERDHGFESRFLQRGVHCEPGVGATGSGSSARREHVLQASRRGDGSSAGRVRRRWRWPASASTYARVLPPNRPATLEGNELALIGNHDRGGVPKLPDGIASRDADIDLSGELGEDITSRRGQRTQYV